jgi:hypothetical protein
MTTRTIIVKEDQYQFIVADMARIGWIVVTAIYKKGWVTIKFTRDQNANR